MATNLSLISFGYAGSGIQPPTTNMGATAAAAAATAAADLHAHAAPATNLGPYTGPQMTPGVPVPKAPKAHAPHVSHARGTSHGAHAPRSRGHSPHVVHPPKVPKPPPPPLALAEKDFIGRDSHVIYGLPHPHLAPVPTRHPKVI